MKWRPKKKKPGPKLLYGKDNKCKRRSLSIPEDLWDWCCGEALFESSVSAFIVKLIRKEKGD